MTKVSVADAKKTIYRQQDDIQFGGGHYKQFGEIQPWNVIAAWGLGFFDGNVLRYISRWRHKGGVEDLKKARHYIDKLIELEEKAAIGG
jgi:hypothetical protein